MVRYTPALAGLLSVLILSGCSVVRGTHERATASGAGSSFVETAESDVSVANVAESALLNNAALNLNLRATARSRLIAADLVGALMQIPGLSVDTLVAEFFWPASSFGRVLARELQRAGYDLRLQKSTNSLALSDSPHLITYSILDVPGLSDPQYEFSVSIGDIQVLRQYKLVGSAVYPIAPFSVSGIAVNHLVSDDKRFAGQNVLLNQPTSASDEPVEKIRSVPLEPAVKKNLYETRRSNFADQLKDYDDVHQSIIVFPNDSVVLGKFNKELVLDMVTEFNSTTDVLSVIGCSHGKTAIANGNQRLAEGRSARIREELIRAAVPAEQVLDEGCWAPRHFDEMMPRRGVVLTLKRLRMAG